MTEMWGALEKYQPYAGRHGFGEVWRRMCEERTEDAADAAWDAAPESTPRRVGDAVFAASCLVAATRVKVESAVLVQIAAKAVAYINEAIAAEKTK